MAYGKSHLWVVSGSKFSQRRLGWLLLNCIRVSSFRTVRTSSIGQCSKPIQNLLIYLPSSFLGPESSFESMPRSIDHQIKHKVGHAAKRCCTLVICWHVTVQLPTTQGPSYRKCFWEVGVQEVVHLQICSAPLLKLTVCHGRSSRWEATDSSSALTGDFQAPYHVNIVVHIAELNFR